MIGKGTNGYGLFITHALGCPSKCALSTEIYCKYKEKFKLAREIKFVRQKALYSCFDKVELISM